MLSIFIAMQQTFAMLKAYIIVRLIWLSLQWLISAEPIWMQNVIIIQFVVATILLQAWTQANPRFLKGKLEEENTVNSYYTIKFQI